MTSLKYKDMRWVLSLSVGVVSGVAVWIISLVTVFDVPEKEIAIANIGDLCTTCGDVPIVAASVYAAAILSGITVLTLFRFQIQKNDDLSAAEQLLMGNQNYANILARVMLTLVVGGLVAAGTFLFFNLLELVAGQPLTYPPGVAAVMTGAYSGIIAYRISSWVIGFRFPELSAIGISVLSLGLLGSVLTASDPMWWSQSVSQLGVDPGSGIIFDAALYTAAALWLAFLIEVHWLLRILINVDSDNRWPRRSPDYILYGGLLICLGAIMVALENKGTIHTIGAVMLAGLFWVAMTIGIGFAQLLPENLKRHKWVTAITLVPDDFSRTFRVVSFLIGLFLAILTLYELLGSDFVNFTGLELIAFASFAFWFYHFSLYTLSYLENEKIEKVGRAIEKVGKSEPEQKDVQDNS